jgi:hypothetical protein
VLYEHEFTHAEAVRYCQIGIVSSPPALTTLCTAAIAVINSSALFNGTVKLVLPSPCPYEIVNQRYSFRYLLYALQLLRVHVVVEPLRPFLHLPYAKNAKTCCEGK